MDAQCFLGPIICFEIWYVSSNFLQHEKLAHSGDFSRIKLLPKISKMTISSQWINLKKSLKIRFFDNEFSKSNYIFTQSNYEDCIKPIYSVASNYDHTNKRSLFFIKIWNVQLKVTKSNVLIVDFVTFAWYLQRWYRKYKLSFPLFVIVW
jgi:hypothetical protein